MTSISRGAIAVALPLLLFALPSRAEAKSWSVAVVVYDGVLTSDVTGPLEVFGAAARKSGLSSFDVTAVSADADLDILTEEGVRLRADRRVTDPGAYDVVIVPSSYAMDAVLANAPLIDFVRRQAKTAEWMASNCSGALVLAEAGLLDGRRATTWRGGEAAFLRKYPGVRVISNTNYVVDGRVLTSNGGVVSYQAALALLSRIAGPGFAAEISTQMQFPQLTGAPVPALLGGFHARIAALVAAGAIGGIIIAFIGGWLLKRRAGRFSARQRMPTG